MALFEALIGSEMKKVEATLVEGFSDSDLEAHVNSLCLSIINAGGKRMRPALVLLAAHLLPTYTDEEEIAVCKLAAGVELLHTATLIHDDVIDNSLMRRGHPTLNSTSGNHVAVLAGDYMFTRCFATIKDLKKADVLNIISDTLATLVTGELDQLKNEGDVNISVEDYYTTIYCKTGALFELSASAPAVYLGEEEKYITALKNYGRYIGNAFQIIDDCLDYSSDSKTLGKNMGAVMAAYKQGQWTLNTDGTLSIGGQNLTSDLFEVRLEMKDGVAGQAFDSNKAVLTLDTVVTDTLKREGMARDFVRLIQTLRKDKDFNISDRIELHYQTANAELAKALAENEKYISEQVLAVKVEPTCASGSEADIEGGLVVYDAFKHCA